MSTRRSHWSLKPRVNEVRMHHQTKASTNGNHSRIELREARDGNREGANVLSQVNRQNNAWRPIIDCLRGSAVMWHRYDHS
jgi:hypothetical protein